MNTNLCKYKILIYMNKKSNKVNMNEKAIFRIYFGINALFSYKIDTK